MRLRVAVVGLGFMGATHLRAWYGVAGAELTAVISADPRKLAGDLSTTGGNLEPAAAQFDFQQVKRFSTLADALADPAIDAVDLCLPTHLHAEAGLAALRAGKHVLLEKPLARTSQQARELVAEATKTGCLLMAGHVLRFFPEYQEISRQVADSKIQLGSFRRNCARPSWSPWLADPALSGGAPLDLLIHDADFVLHTFGYPETVSAQGHVDHVAGIDWLSATSSFRNGKIANITGGWHPSSVYPFSMEFNVITEHGTIDWSSAGRPLTSFRTNAPPEIIALPEAPDPWRDQLQYFADCALAHAPPALCPPSESADAVRFVEIMVESRNRKGELLPWTN
jgi:predicted dehydrogenase